MQDCRADLLRLDVGGMDEAGQEKGLERVSTCILELQCQQSLLHAIHTLHQRQLHTDGEVR